ncbi:hypothetical protein JB92DRAFT_3311022 [Gautieria morchelliformis]|nr:hypothetical protein JB92DRAFT_3311022 [Gautieria morchelliformis]
MRMRCKDERTTWDDGTVRQCRARMMKEDKPLVMGQGVNESTLSQFIPDSSYPPGMSLRYGAVAWLMLSVNSLPSTRAWRRPLSVLVNVSQALTEGTMETTRKSLDAYVQDGIILERPDNATYSGVTEANRPACSPSAGLVAPYPANKHSRQSHLFHRASFPPLSCVELILPPTTPTLLPALLYSLSAATPLSRLPLSTSAPPRPLSLHPNLHTLPAICFDTTRPTG